MQCAALHPIDQLCTFVVLREKGKGAEEKEAVFFVTPRVVRQCLKLAVWPLPCSIV